MWNRTRLWEPNVNAEWAEANLWRLLARVALGEEIAISNGGVPVAKLVPFDWARDRVASLGLGKSVSLCRTTSRLR